MRNTVGINKRSSAKLRRVEVEDQKIVINLRL